VTQTAAGATPPLLAAHGLWRSFAAVVAVRDVSLDFPVGSVTAIVGDNGAGKTTLIKLLTGVLRPDQGTLQVDGAEVRFHSPAEARAMGIETVHQDLALAEHRNVTANLFMGREKTRGFGPLRLLATGEMHREAQSILQDLKVQVPSVKLEARKLSGGQRQAVAIGRAAHWGSRLLVMDEPLAALGVREATRVEELIQGLARRGLTQIIVSHNLDHVFSLSTRVAIMRLGRLVGIRETADTSREEIVRMIAGLDGGPAQ
jgi:ABC-type sugar transport system ATPase subunit